MLGRLGHETHQEVGSTTTKLVGRDRPKFIYVFGREDGNIVI